MSGLLICSDSGQWISDKERDIEEESEVKGGFPQTIIKKGTFLGAHGVEIFYSWKPIIDSIIKF